jgi:hypothetical protein
MDLFFRHWNMIQPAGTCHTVITLRVTNRQATLISKIYMPARPVGSRVAQGLVNGCWRTPSRQYDTKPTSLLNTVVGHHDQGIDHILSQ